MADGPSVSWLAETVEVRSSARHVDTQATVLTRDAETSVTRGVGKLAAIITHSLSFKLIAAVQRTVAQHWYHV